MALLDDVLKVLMGSPGRNMAYSNPVSAPGAFLTDQIFKPQARTVATPNSGSHPTYSTQTSAINNLLRSLPIGQPQVQPQQPTAPVNSFAEPTQNQTTAIPGTDEEKKKKPSFFETKLGQALLRGGVPLGAAIAGSINPNMLAGAAGLAGGYNTGFNRMEDIGIEIGKTEQEFKNKKDKEEKERMPSRESLLKMAQSEAYRLKGGSMFAGLALQDPGKRADYDAEVKRLYNKYTDMFRGESPETVEESKENIDTDYDSQVNNALDQLGL